MVFCAGRAHTICTGLWVAWLPLVRHRMMRRWSVLCPGNGMLVAKMLALFQQCFDGREDRWARLARCFRCKHTLMVLCEQQLIMRMSFAASQGSAEVVLICLFVKLPMVYPLWVDYAHAQ